MIDERIEFMRRRAKNDRRFWWIYGIVGAIIALTVEFSTNHTQQLTASVVLFCYGSVACAFAAHGKDLSERNGFWTHFSAMMIINMAASGIFYGLASHRETDSCGPGYHREHVGPPDTYGDTSCEKDR